MMRPHELNNGLNFINYERFIVFWNYFNRIFGVTFSIETALNDFTTLEEIDIVPFVAENIN